MRLHVEIDRETLNYIRHSPPERSILLGYIYTFGIPGDAINITERSEDTRRQAYLDDNSRQHQRNSIVKPLVMNSVLGDLN